jgi:c-di-AMP phosphodiesterase-like protein
MGVGNPLIKTPPQSWRRWVYPGVNNPQPKTIIVMRIYIAVLIVLCAIIVIFSLSHTHASIGGITVSVFAILMLGARIAMYNNRKRA